MATNLIEVEQLELFGQALCEAQGMHHLVRGGFPYLTLNHTETGRDWPRQKSIPVDKLEWAVRQIYTRPTWREEDWWISQSDFFARNRRKVHLWSLGGCWVDLDFHSERGDDATIRHFVERTLEACESQRIPQPSVIVWSGGGLHVKWVFGEPLPGKALPVWQACQRTLHAAMVAAGLPSDPKSLDASRILRVVGTINQRYRKWREERFVTVVHRGPTWPWHLFRSEVLPYSEDDIRQFRQRDAQRKADAEAARQRWQDFEQACRQWEQWDDARRKAREWLAGIERRVAQDAAALLWHDRLVALRDIAIARGGIREGQRNNWSWVIANAVAWGLDTSGLDLFQEVSVVLRYVAPSYSAAEIRSSASSVLSRFKAEKDALYRFKTETLTRQLGISQAEAEAHGLLDAGRRGHGTKNPGAMGLPKLRDLPFDVWKERVRERFAEGGRYAAAVRDESALVEARRRAQEASAVIRHDNTMPDRMIARELRRQGMTYEAIAQELRVSVSTAWLWCQ